MGTVVELRVSGAAGGRLSARRAEHAIEAAARWFDRVEQDCSRFDPASELRRLCATVNRPVVISPLLFGALHFAVAVARETDGAFDPTIGATMERLGFDRHHRTGKASRSTGGDASWRDVQIDDASRAVTLSRPLTLDLGAVAKGLAMDLAARELAALDNFAIDAGRRRHRSPANRRFTARSAGQSRSSPISGAAARISC
jgi:thiamine biosynthesis lipoprotein